MEKDDSAVVVGGSLGTVLEKMKYILENGIYDTSMWCVLYI